jgi:NADP-reducing hydrogenase subunit HndB
MITSKGLKDIKRKTIEKINPSKESKVTRITIGLGTCGIAAGADAVYDAIVDEISKLGIRNVVVAKVGCIGTCRLEPIVEVVKPGEEKVTYVKISPYKARRIVASHILVGPIIEDYTVHVIQGKILNDFTLYNE